MVKQVLAIRRVQSAKARWKVGPYPATNGGITTPMSRVK